MSLKVIELFAGIGSPRKALNNLNIDHEIVTFSEKDKYAEESYRAIHNDYKTENMGDITKIKELPACDLLVFGSPCQDISIAGKQQGIQEGTRSGLLLEVLRLLEVYKNKKTLPKHLLLENVSNILSKEHRKEFQNYLLFLEKLGYKNFYKVLNAVEHEMPQNRERLFCLSILDQKARYNFPEPKKLKIFLRDLLEKEVDKKYFLSELYRKRFDESLYNNKLQAKIPNKILGTTVNPKAKGTNSRHWVYDVNGLITTIDATTYKQPKQIILDNKLRKITPRECFRLMGFTDDDFDRVKAIGMSDTQLYKQAGNSIVVNVLEAIFKNLFLEEETPVIQKLF